MVNPLNELTLPTIMYLDVFDERPELAVALHPLMICNERNPPEALLRWGGFLADAGRPSDTERLVPRMVDHGLWLHRRGHSYDFTWVLEVLVRISPSATLTLLRRTRGRGVRRWSDEREGFRLLYGALANQQLHRKRQARALCERALRQPSYMGHRERCQRLLEELTP
jgi:hypothetical protein